MGMLGFFFGGCSDRARCRHCHVVLRGCSMAGEWRLPHDDLQASTFWNCGIIEVLISFQTQNLAYGVPFAEECCVSDHSCQLFQTPRQVPTLSNALKRVPLCVCERHVTGIILRFSASSLYYMERGINFDWVASGKCTGYLFWRKWRLQPFHMSARRPPVWYQETRFRQGVVYLHLPGNGFLWDMNDGSLRRCCHMLKRPRLRVVPVGHRKETPPGLPQRQR